MTINTEAILIGILAITLQILIYYQFLIKPILEELKAIKEKQDDIEQYRLKKMNYQLDQINAKLDKLTEQNKDKPE